MEGFYIITHWQPTAAAVLNTSYGAKDQGIGRALSHQTSKEAGHGEENSDSKKARVL